MVHLVTAPTNDAPRPLQLQRIFAGKRLLVLGGTGFLGKIFWCMLLSRFPDIGRIYLLVRSSKAAANSSVHRRDSAPGQRGMTSEERFWSQIATSKALDPLRHAHPGPAYEQFLREKIVCIDGDVGRPACGLSAEVIAQLRGQVDAVINVAGVVDFNPPLDEALDANAFGSQNLVGLAKALGDLPLMHTSTCYTAGRRREVIREQDPREVPFPRVQELGRELWDPDREIADCLDLIAQANHRCDDAFRQSVFTEQARKNLLERGEPTEGPAFAAELARVRRRFVADRLIEAGRERAIHWGWPNIYTYTKSIGEQVIARSGLRWTIGRPACCESTVEFPFPGWNEGISTSAPIIYLFMKGQLSVPGGEVPLDFIPTDYVAAGMILTAAELLEGTQAPVYQYGTSDVNPATAARLGELMGLYKRKYFLRQRGSRLANFVQAHLEPVVIEPKLFDAFGAPAVAKASETVADLIRSIPALQPAAATLDDVARTQKRVAKIMHLFQPFMYEENGPFSCENTRRAHARLSAEDQAKLPWRPEAIDWTDYMMGIHLPAVEKFIMPEMDKKAQREVRPQHPHRDLVSLLDQMAERHDLSVALQRLERDGFSRVTYRDLKARTLAVQARLANVPSGSHVLLSAKNDPDWVIAFFGILRAGGVVVPIDSEADARSIERLATDCQARACVVDSEARTRFEAALGPTCPLFDVHELTADGAAASASSPMDPSSVACLIYTSGTTGRPKGVRLSHTNFVSLLASLSPLFPLGPADRLLSLLPLHHTFELTCGMLLPLSRGARVVYVDRNSKAVEEALATGLITGMVGVPAIWRTFERKLLARLESRGPVAARLFDAGLELNRMLSRATGISLGRLFFGVVSDDPLGKVRWLISGGSALPRETQKLFAGLGLPLREGYGLTEAAPVLTVSGSSPREPFGQVGRPIPGVRIRIANPDASGVGEVLARGPNVMVGYTDEELTRQAIDEDGWLHTGDLGRLDKAGRLFIVGRIKDLIATNRGENVFPDEVEQALGAVPHIAELAIVGVTTREGEQVGCLAVPSDEPSMARAAARDRALHSLRDALAKLPEHHRPVIVHLHEGPLPRTASHKVKREEIRGSLERIDAAAAHLATTRSRSIRKAIAALSDSPAAEVDEETALQEDLGFDATRLRELRAALECQFGAVDAGSLDRCRTVADVERLVRQDSRHPSDVGVKSRSPSRPGLFGKVGERAVRGLQRGVLERFFRVAVDGQTFVPQDRPVLVVANLESPFDFDLVAHALGRHGEGLRCLATEEGDGRTARGSRVLWNGTSSVLIAHDKIVARDEVAIAAALDAGRNVVVFSRPSRGRAGEVSTFKPLVGKVALSRGIDLLPVWLEGTAGLTSLALALQPSKGRRLRARVGAPLPSGELRRLTKDMDEHTASRHVADLARLALLALERGEVMDLATPDSEPKKAPTRPIVRLFDELRTRYRAGQVDKPISYYVTLGSDDLDKWTVLVSADQCEVHNAKPPSGRADCVLKTSFELFEKIVREGWTPTAAEFVSGAVKTSDVSLLLEFQKAFRLG